MPILISGFSVCNHNPYYFYRLHRYEGQYLYLKSALLGMGCLFVATFVYLGLNFFLPPKIFGIPVDVISFLNSLIDAAVDLPKESSKELSWVLLLSVFTQGIGWLWIAFSFWHIKKKDKNLEKSKIILMSTILSDSPLDNLLLESYINESPLMLTLNDRKVYVGIVSSLGEPNENEGMDQEISLIPLMSGYRDKDNFHVSFNTDYKIIAKDLNIILRQEIINSATTFDFDVYLEFLEHRTPEIRETPEAPPKAPKIFFWK